MYRSHSAYAEREVPVRDLAPRAGYSPKILRVITRLNIGGPAMHTLLLTRELAAHGYRTALVSGNCEAEEGDVAWPLEAGEPVHWVPELSRSVRPWMNLK